MINKIAIVGNSGSGKTTLAMNLEKKMQLPLYHIDKYYWGENWQRPDPEEFKERYEGLCLLDKWIIEGAYIKGFRYRAAHSDIIIFIDLPRRICLWRVIKRTLFNWRKVVPGVPNDCKQRLFSAKFLIFLKWVWDFDKKHRATILNVLDEFKDIKLVYIFKTNQDAQNFLEGKFN